MLVKNLSLGLLLGFVASTSAMAATHTVSLGYGQSKINESEGLKDLKGVNVQYQYETQSPWGAVVSSSYLTGDETLAYDSGRDKIDGKYFSLLAGPSYRFNEYVSTYVLAGFSHVKAEVDELDFDGTYHSNAKNSETGFAYGVGLTVNPIQNVAINVGYEGTNVDSTRFNGFNVGVGYRF